MHTKLLEAATHSQLKCFLYEMFDDLKENNHELYEKYEMELYREIYGEHFNQWLLEKATKNMKNEDGTTGCHWSLEQTNDVAKRYNITFDHFNEYDWNYVMNMIYSDYYGAVPDEVDAYVKLAKKFIMDKDAKHGKALAYYFAVKE